jgi:hypothetical protein
MKTTYLFAIGILVTTLFTQCRQEGCTDIEANNFSMDAKKDDGTCLYNGNANLNFNFVFGSAMLPWSLSETFNHPKTGDDLNFSAFSFYLSDIKLQKEDGSWWEEENSVHLVCVGCDNGTQVSLMNIPEGSYTNMAYTLGLNQDKISSWEAAGELSTDNGMYINDAYGYMMIKVEGTSPQSSTGSFKFYLTGSGTNPITQEKTTDFSGETLTIEKGQTVNMNLIGNPAKLWHSAADIATTNEITVPGSEASTMAETFFGGILFKEIE